MKFEFDNHRLDNGCHVKRESSGREESTKRTGDQDILESLPIFNVQVETEELTGEVDE